MVIKILGSSGKFSGIDYNERKSVDGRGELLIAKNFTALEFKGTDISKQDYIDYLTDYSSSNSRVKDSQFHATISGKGKEYDFEELQRIGEQYLDYMGYGDNPFLIYAHSDTTNNHIHVVTSRIAQDGRKISDSYEKVKSQNFINQVLKINPHTDFALMIGEIKNFRFSSIGQFRMLAERKGFAVITKEDGFALIRGGVTHGLVTNSELHKWVTPVDEFDARRIAQVKMIIQKFRVLHDTSLKWEGERRPGRNASATVGHYFSDFSDEMRKKFGLEFVYHKAKNNNVYSYSVLDHDKRQVYKGSDILEIRELLKSGRVGDPVELLREVVEQATISNVGFIQLKRQLKDQGLIINKNGTVRRKNEIYPIYTLDPVVLKLLKYQSRLAAANEFLIPGKEEAELLSKLCHVAPKDLVIKKTNLYTDLGEKINSIIHNLDHLQVGFHKVGVDLIKYDGKLFFVDIEKKVVISAENILPPAQLTTLIKSQNVDFKNLGTSEFSKSKPAKEHFYDGPESALLSLKEISYLIGSIDDETDPAEVAAKRRRRVI